MFAIRFNNKINRNWTFCIRDGKTMVFETKKEAENFVTEIRKAVAGLNLDYVYEVVTL